MVDDLLIVDDLLHGLQRRDRRALSRLLTLAARGEHLAEIETALVELTHKTGRVVAFTGSGGVGKSTLIGKLIEHARGQNRTVAVLACDPQSPLTGGALLGDRFRMGDQGDDAVFIRSLAAPGGGEAIAPHLSVLVTLLHVFGFDFIFLETVGAGQSDTAVSRLADLVVLLLQPESGDDLQWEKAGVLEVADIIVVHKADLPGAERTLAQVKSSLELSVQRDIPVLGVSSQSGAGVAVLSDLLRTRSPRGTSQASPELERLAHAEFEERWRAIARTEPCQRLAEQWRKGKLSAAEARRALWRMLMQ